MSSTGELSAVEPALVDVEEGVEVDAPSPSAAALDEEPDVVVLDPAGPIVTVDPIPLENPVDPALPPQEAWPRRRATKSEAARTRQPV